MGVGGALVGLLTAIGEGDARAVGAFLDADPALMADRLDRADERFIPRCHAQLYAGDTALHAAAFAYDVTTARRLVDAGSSVRARNRRSAEPLHAATMGVPGSTNWDPDRQRAVIEHLFGRRGRRGGGQ